MDKNRECIALQKEHSGYEKGPNRVLSKSTGLRSNFLGFSGSGGQQCDCPRRGAGSSSDERMRQQKCLFRA